MGHTQSPESADRGQEPFNYHAIIPGSWDNDNFEKACAVWSLTPSEIEQLRDLQRRLSDLAYWKNEPHHILWFMKGPLGYYSTSVIEQHFRKMVQWRIENDIDGLLDRYQPPPLHLQNTVSSVLKDCDRDGDPIYVERGGAMNAGQVLKKSSKAEMIEYAVWIRETHMRGAWKEEYERRTGHPVRNITIIYDLKGLSASHLDPRVINVFKDVIKITKEYYSAPVKRMIVIRAPALFCAAWAIVQHIFPVGARRKMIFAGTADYLEVLHQYVDLDVLPRCIYSRGHGSTGPGMPKLIGEEEEDGLQRELARDESSACRLGPHGSQTTCASSAIGSHSEDLDFVAAPIEVSCRKILSGGWDDEPWDADVPVSERFAAH